MSKVGSDSELPEVLAGTMLESLTKHKRIELYLSKQVKQKEEAHSGFNAQHVLMAATYEHLLHACTVSVGETVR